MGPPKTAGQMFLWSIALVYVCAFASIYVQLPGLYGDDGMVPVRLLMSKEQGPLLEQFQSCPSLVWLGQFLGLEPQHALELICVLGVVLSLAAVLLGSLRDSVIYFCLWALYLSIYNVGKEFVHSEWDILLLEAGFLAVLVAPFGLLRGHSVSRDHDSVTFWLTRWLLFRLTFCTGVSKLASGDSAWWKLTALSHHFENHISPTPLAWYFRQLPVWFLRFEAVVLLHCEIAVPLLMFLNPIRRLRLVGFYIQLILQVVYMLMGSCSLLNLLSIALSFSLLDDDHFISTSSAGQKKKKKTRTWRQSLVSGLLVLLELAVYGLILVSEVLLFKLQINWEEKTISCETNFTKEEFDEYLKYFQVPIKWVPVLLFTWEAVAAMLMCVCSRSVCGKLWSLLQCMVMTVAAACILAITMVPYLDITGIKVFPEVRKAYSMVEGYHLVGAYGIHHRPLSVDGRPEIILEGSHDGLSWKEINLMYKPGSVNAAPPIPGVHQPKLELAMWQAATGAHNESPWFAGLVHRLLQGKPEVVSLVQADEAQYPFSKRPPTFIKANIYKYHFTDPAKDKSDPQAWWRRSYSSEFLPIVKLDDPTHKKMLEQTGLQIKLPVQPSTVRPVSQALSLMRGQVKGLSGALVLSTLLATLAGIFLIKIVLSCALGSRKPKPATADHKTKKPAESTEKSHGASASNRGNKKDNSEDRKVDSERSPRKRK